MSPYYIDPFKQWAWIKEEDAQTEALSKLETAIRLVCGDETDEVVSLVATMMESSSQVLSS